MFYPIPGKQQHSGNKTVQKCPLRSECFHYHVVFICPHSVKHQHNVCILCYFDRLYLANPPLTQTFFSRVVHSRPFSEYWHQRHLWSWIQSRCLTVRYLVTGSGITQRMCLSMFCHTCSLSIICQETAYFVNSYKVSCMYFIVIATKLEHSVPGRIGNLTKIKKFMKPTQVWEYTNLINFKSSTWFYVQK